MQSCYNRCIKLFLGFKRRDGLTSIPMNLGLPRFDTALANARAYFVRLLNSSDNHIVTYLQQIIFLDFFFL